VDAIHHHSFRIALLAGGDSPEREVSLASGARVRQSLAAAGHEVQWIDPAETDLSAVDWDGYDVCFLALHGGAGEDGRVQEVLQARGVPYTGSGPAASHAAMSKSLAKALFEECGVPTPDYALLYDHDPPAQIVAKVIALGLPVVVKPDAGGSSVGVGLVREGEEILRAVNSARQCGRLVLAERFVGGRELTVAVLGRAPLPVVEILRPGEVFDYHSKYASPATEYRFHTAWGPIKVEEVQRTAVSAAAALGTSGLVRVDLIVDGSARPWVLEVNTLPGMTDHSLAPMAAARAGIEFPALCTWMVTDALVPKGLSPG